MTSIIKENNGVSFETSPQTYIRGAAKGQLYQAFIPTVESLNDYVTFRGAKYVVDVLSRAEKLDAQAALDNVLGDSGWIKTSVVDPETGKQAERETFNPEDVDWNKVVDIILSGVVRGGVTKGQLEEEREAAIQDQQKLLLEAQSYMSSGRAGDAQSLFVKALELTSKIQELDVAIAAKSKTRRTKEELSAVQG